MGLLWEDRAWEEYLYWQTQDKKTLKRLNAVNRMVSSISLLVVGIMKNSRDRTSPTETGEVFDSGGSASFPTDRMAPAVFAKRAEPETNLNFIT